MSNLITATMTPERFNERGNFTGVKVGQYWLSISTDFAGMLRQGEPADITYDEVERNGKTYYNITAVNGTPTKGQKRSSGGPGEGGGGPGRAGPASGPGAPAKGPGAAPGAAKGAYEGAWAGMGPENRARMVADAFVREMYKGTAQHPGKEALANDFRITYEAWLAGCEGRQFMTGGNSGPSEEPPDYGNDPGAGSEGDYA